MDATGSLSRTRTTVISIFCLLLLALAAPGCKSTPTADSSPGDPTAPTGTLDRALADYAAGRYLQANAAADRLIRTTSGADRQRAHYIAGLSAYRLGRSGEARRHLAAVADTPDDAIAGPANATLGLIAAADEDFDAAVGYFRNAIPHLTGEDLAQAYFHMAVAEQKIGRWSAARAHLDLAARRTRDADLRSLINQRKDATAFTLQFGAYRDATNARTQAGKHADAARRAGLGDMQIEISVSTRGGTWYLVQAGRFPDYPAAQRATKRLTPSTLIVPRIE